MLSEWGPRRGPLNRGIEMVKADDVLDKRHFLSHVRLRFSPEVQEAKETAVDSIIEHIIFACDPDKWLTGAEIGNRMRKILGINVAEHHLLVSLERLVGEGRIESTPESLPGVRLKGPKKVLYSLSSEAKKKLDDQERQARQRFESACRALFGESKAGWSAYAEPFLKFLSIVFSRLADENARMIRGEMSQD